MDYTNFRSAIGGFRRSDVFAYIERTSQEHRQVLRDLEKKNAALQAENESLKEQLAAVQLAAEPSEAPVCEAPENLELSAYRRAEATERAARRRAARLNEQVTALTEKASATLCEVDEASKALAAQTAALLSELKESIAALETILDSDSCDENE